MDDSPALPDDTRLGRIALRVADRTATVEFYRDVVGLRVLDRGDDPDGESTATLGVDGTPLLVVLEEPTAAPRDERETGLYHNAFRVPSRAALGAALNRIRNRWTLEGASDHGISEALYCADPEGNGFEIYCDRPREAWPRADDGTVRAAGGPLDIEALADAADGAAEPTGDHGHAAPAGTTLGHVHLEVSSLEAAREFYAGTLGFDVSMGYAPGALFFAAGGYHHHIGANVWNGRSTPADGPGLAWVELLVPDAAAVDAVRARAAADDDVTVADIGDCIEITDPDGIAIRVRRAASAPDR